MDNEVLVLSKFKNNLGNIIDDYKNKISEIIKEEDFIQTLGDFINYCKSDVLLLPFYDETILSRIFERVFPLSQTEINKVKTFKYLIDASKDIDKTHFTQYNNTLKEVNKIYKKLSSYYDKLLSDNILQDNKNKFETNVNNYTSIYNIIEEEGFNSLIEDVDLFKEVVELSDLSLDEINILLDVAIKDNLKYLDSNGVISSDICKEIEDLKNENNVIQDSIRDLSNLLGDE